MATIDGTMNMHMPGTDEWWKTTAIHGHRGILDSILRLLEQDEISRAKAAELIGFAYAPDMRHEHASQYYPLAPWDKLYWGQ